MRKYRLVIGIANEHSIATGCTWHFAAAGATLVATHLNEKARPFVAAAAQPLSPALLRTRYGRLDLLLHAIAFAPRDDLHGRVTDCSAVGFAMAMDVSCHSFV